MIKRSIVRAAILLAFLSVPGSASHQCPDDGGTPPDRPAILNSTVAAADELLFSTGQIRDYSARLPTLEKGIHMLQGVLESEPSLEVYKELALFYSAKAYCLTQSPSKGDRETAHKYSVLSGDMCLEAAKLAPDETTRRQLELMAAREFEFGGDWKRAREYSSKWLKEEKAVRME
jgi:hypothetical protein